MNKSFLFLSILCLISSLLGSEKPVFKFTAIPDQDDTRLVERFSGMAEYLSEKLGIKVEYVPVKSYAASVAAFKNGDVQMAWFGGLSGVKARRAVKDAVAIAQGEEDTQFVSYFIANISTGLKYSEEFPLKMKGYTFTFGSKGSTSGRLMPEFYLRENFKSAPEKVFKRVGFSGDHSKTIALVESGSYQIGATNYKVWEKEVAEGKIDTTKVNVIWKTPAYVDYNWTIRGDVESTFRKGFIKEVQTALIELTDKNLLDKFPRRRFIEANNEIYAPILKTGMEIGIFDE